MSGKDKDKSRKPKRKGVAAMITEETENGSSEEDNGHPEGPQAQQQASFPGARPPDASKDAAATSQSVEVQGGASRSKSPLAKVGAKISSFLRRTPPRSLSESASPKKKVATEQRWAAPEEPASSEPGPSKQGAAQEEQPTMALIETPPDQKEPEWTNPRYKPCPDELYGPLYDPLHNRMSGPVEHIPLVDSRGVKVPTRLPDLAPLATTEDMCSPAAVEDFDEPAAAASPSTAATRTSEEPPRRSPPPSPLVPPPQPQAPPPEPEERDEDEDKRKRRPRRKGESKR